MQRQAASLLYNVAHNDYRTMQEQREFIQRPALRQGLNNTLSEPIRWEHDVQAYLQHAPYLKAVALTGPEGEL